jgi:hypothetical protein
MLAEDSTAVLKPDQKYLELTNNKYEQTDNITGIKTFFAPDSDGSFSPKKALVLSMITPGLGHIYVRKPLKAVLYFTAEVYYIQRSWHFNELYKQVKKTQDMMGKDVWLTLTKDEKNQAIIDSTGEDIGMNYWRPKEKRNKRMWWSVGVYIISMLDAYVDAHLSDFPEGDLEFINDTGLKSRGIQFSIPIKGIKK